MFPENSPYFIIYAKKTLTIWVCLLLTIFFVERQRYTTNIIIRTITKVIIPDPLLWVMLWNPPWGSSPDNWSASCSAKVSKLVEEGRCLEKVSKISFCNNCTFRESLSCMFCQWNLICSQLYPPQHPRPFESQHWKCHRLREPRKAFFATKNSWRLEKMCCFISTCH